ncbi:MAG: DMT family transporter [Sphingobium sp.]
MLAPLACLLGVATFSIMDATMKELALGVGAYSALLFRSLLGAILGGGAMLATRTRWPDRSTLALHVRRGIVITGMSWTFFWSLTRLPLAEAIALSFIAPIIALYLAALLLKERVGRTAILSALLGLAGIGIVLSGRLSGDYDGRALEGAAGILISAVLFAYNLVLQRQLAQRAGAIEMSFCQNGVMLLLFTPLAPFLAAWPSPTEWKLVLLATGLVVASQLSLGWAYARAPASRLIPLEYSAFIWAALLGWLVFGETLSARVVAGAAVIVAACLIASRRQRGLERIDIQP